jgi:hypothetical protein
MARPDKKTRTVPDALRALDRRLRRVERRAKSPFLYGTGAPAHSLGSNGDFYFEQDDGGIYFKSGGVWTIVSHN